MGPDFYFQTHAGLANVASSFKTMASGLTKRLLDDNTRLLRGPVNDGRFDIIPLCWYIVHFTAQCDLPPLFGNVCEKSLDTFVLHRILEGPMRDARLRAVSDGEVAGVLHHGRFEGVVYRLVHVDALEVQADLARVEKGPGRDFFCDFVHVHVWEDDCWIIAAPVYLVQWCQVNQTRLIFWLDVCKMLTVPESLASKSLLRSALQPCPWLWTR